MKLAKYVFGLGNPDSRYARSPHNLGFLFIDRMLAKFPSIEKDKTKLQDLWNCLVVAHKAEEISQNSNGSTVSHSQNDYPSTRIIPEHITLLASKPKTFMNLSGQAVREVYNKFSDRSAIQFVRNLIVVHDDVDLPEWQIKMKDGRINGGHRGHNGVRNIGECMCQAGLNREQSTWFMRIRIGCKRTYNGPLRDYVLSDMQADEWKEWGRRIDEYLDSKEFLGLALAVG